MKWSLVDLGDVALPLERLPVVVEALGEFFAASSRGRPGPGGRKSGSKKGGGKRGGKTTGRKTTARKGTAKSAAARARSQSKRSKGAGRSKTSGGKSRTTSGPVSRARKTNPGPGDVRRPHV